MSGQCHYENGSARVIISASESENSLQSCYESNSSVTLGALFCLTAQFAP